MENRVDEGSVRHRYGDEDPGQPMRREPAFVGRAREPADRARPAGGAEARREGPDGKHEQPEQRQVAERRADPGRVAVGRRGRERPVGEDQQHSCRCRAPVPDGDAVEAGERPLDRGQQRGENEGAGEEQDRLGAAKLADEAGSRLARRPCREPEGEVRGRHAYERDAA